MDSKESRRDEKLAAWLQQLIAERLSAELKVLISHRPQRAYRLVRDAKAIEIPAWHWELGDSVDDMDWFYPASEGFRSSIGEALPAPGGGLLRKPVVEESSTGYIVHYDVLGMACWALSRAEEVGRSDVDEHGRFPATSSHAYRHGYLDRPLVDEWFALLAQLVNRLWPGMPIAEHAFEVRLSHDVDQPSAFAFRSTRQMLQSACGDVLKRGDLKTAFLRPRVWCRSRQELHPSDPYNTFDWLMDASEERGVSSTFYFVCAHSVTSHDPEYDLVHPAIRSLLRRINARGHEIGLHPSYGTYRSPALIRQEAQKLFAVCAQEEISQDAWGARMHYLRLVMPETLYGIQDAQLDYDATLGYADQPGFRCGTSMEYVAFDPVEWQPLRLRIRPLVAMDCTVLDPYYMGLGATEAALDVFVSLKRHCRKTGGSFALLWHNSQLHRDGERELYESILDA